MWADRHSAQPDDRRAMSPAADPPPEPLSEQPPSSEGPSEVHPRQPRRGQLMLLCLLVEQSAERRTEEELNVGVGGAECGSGRS